MDDPRPITLLIADDHPLILAGLAALVRLEPALALVGEAADAVTAVEQYLRLRPDVMLVDLNMPGGGGVEAIRKIRALVPDARIVILTTYDGDDFQINIPRDAGTLVGIGPNINFNSITVTRTENANGYQMKVSVPWNALNGAASQVGKTIGFDVAINDDRDGGTRETQVMLFGSAQNYLNTSQFGDLTLTP